VRINEDGTATIQCGAMEIGQGSDTVICQIVAEELGLPMEDVASVSADTDATPYTWLHREPASPTRPETP